MNLRIATRASTLALWQANHVAGLLRAAHPDCEVNLVEVTSTGDRDQSQPLRQFGGQGTFTREVQHVVLEGRADLAVHSLKDLPTEPVDGLTLACVPERESTSDALVLPAGRDAIDSLTELHDGARVGTGSPRRQAQLLNGRPDLNMLEIRGNVETRLRKLDEGDFDAIVLAVAGLRRLELTDRISLELTTPVVYPAVGQGALGIECRSDDGRTIGALAALDHKRSHDAVRAERSLLAELRAGCHAPLGVDTGIDGTTLSLSAVVLSLDGTTRVEASASGNVSEPERVGQDAASRLIDAGAGELVGQT